MVGGPAQASADGIVVIGMSAGGLQALREIAIRLPLDLDAGVVIAHHTGPSSVLPVLLTRWSGREVTFARAGEPVERNHVYVCPPQHHIAITADRTIALSTHERIEAVRPSIDWLFTSAAATYRDRAIGLILSGANADGARGLRQIVNAGGRAIVQDVATCEYSAMTEAALTACPEAVTVRPQALAAEIVRAVISLDKVVRGPPHSRAW